MKSAVSLLVVILTLSVASVAPQTRLLSIAAVEVIDVVDGQNTPKATVAIRASTITSVLRDGQPPAHARDVDGRGKFLIPGLSDMHATTSVACIRHSV